MKRPVAVAALTALITLVLSGPSLAAAAAGRAGGVDSPAGPSGSVALATSNNWSGYAAQASHAFTEAVGTWIQPEAMCDGSSGKFLSAFWVGLDGLHNDTVEQIGTKSNCQNGSPGYNAWWQMYPSPKVDLPESTYPVQPGDRLTARVVRSGTSYTLSLRSSEGWAFSTVQTGAGENSSAEWIASSPPLCPTCAFAALTDFGSVSFSGAEAAVGGALRPASSFALRSGPQEITMLGQGGITRARPGPLSTRGQGFDVVWEHA